MTRPGPALLRSFIAVLLILGLSLVLVHWHPEKSGQDCGLCVAHQMPGLQSSAVPFVESPGVYEWYAVLSEQILISSAFVPSHAGRAPPSPFSALFA
jgi:hypothetical protein